MPATPARPAAQVLPFPQPKVPSVEDLVAWAGESRTHPVPPPFRAIDDALAILRFAASACLNCIEDYERQRQDPQAVVARLLAFALHLLQTSFRTEEEVPQ